MCAQVRVRLCTNRKSGIYRTTIPGGGVTSEITSKSRVCRVRCSFWRRAKRAYAYCLYATKLLRRIIEQTDFSRWNYSRQSSTFRRSSFSFIDKNTSSRSTRSVYLLFLNDHYIIVIRVYVLIYLQLSIEIWIQIHYESIAFALSKKSATLQYRAWPLIYLRLSLTIVPSTSCHTGRFSCLVQQSVCLPVEPRKFVSKLVQYIWSDCCVKALLPSYIVKFTKLLMSHKYCRMK